MVSGKGHGAEAPGRLEAEDSLRLVQGAREHAILLIGPEGGIESWNDGAERITGWSAAEIVGRPLAVLYGETPAGVEQAASDLCAAIGEGHRAHEGWWFRKDGTRFWASAAFGALRDADGGLRGVSAVVQDVTERRRSSVLLESVLSHAIDGIISIDERGTVETFNPAAERIFGYREGEVLGQNVKMLMPMPYRIEHDGYLENYLRTGIAKIIGIGREVAGKRKDGTTFPLELAITEFQLDVDGRRHFTGIVRDLSEKSKLEEQLRQAQKMEAIGQLAGGIAHDFNNLLTIISGYSAVLLERMAQAEPLRKHVDQIHRAGERASAMTRQLLAFSRQQVLEPRVIDVNGVIRDSETLLKRLIGEDVVLTTALDERIERVKADPGQVGQVLMNLIVNARDAMPGGGRLTVATRGVELGEDFQRSHPEAKQGRYVMVSVSDTGTGMDAATRSRIFDPFFTTKGAGRGTGLGLAVVYGIVQQSGGSIDVYSEPGVGTTFKLYLPAVAEPGGAPTPPASTEQPRGSETVLLVEDDDGVRELGHFALTSYGFNVLRARSGKEALEILAEAAVPIDLLVTDVVMPEMSGRQLAEALRESYPVLRVLFVSGYTSDAIVRHGILQADVAFLQKPFTPAGLAWKVREVLDQE